jgi:hypothetical protein
VLGAPLRRLSLLAVLPLPLLLSLSFLPTLTLMPPHPALAAR